jgi:methylisocitrate lyase
MTRFEEQRKKIRNLVNTTGLMLPGAFNALSAKLIEQAGFQGVSISGAGLANGQGFPDIGLLSLTEVVSLSKYIVNAVNLPCILDVDTGFGESSNVARTIEECEAIGLAGIHIEDQIFPKRCGHLEGKELISKDAMCEKIRRAVYARNDKNFLIIARTDARSVEGFDKAVERGKAYVKAGADAIFIEALKTKDEFKKFAKEFSIPLLANMTEFGKSPLLSFPELSSMGYKIVIYPMTVFRVMARACEDAYKKLFTKGTQKNFINKMQTRQELYDVLDYDRYAKIDKKVTGYK